MKQTLAIILSFFVTTSVSASYVTPEEFSREYNRSNLIARVVPDEDEEDTFYESSDFDDEEYVDDADLEQLLRESRINENEGATENEQSVNPPHKGRVFYRAGKVVDIATSVKSENTIDELPDYTDFAGDDDWVDFDEATKTVDDFEMEEEEEDDTWSDYSGLIEEAGWEPEEECEEGDEECLNAKKDEESEEEREELHAAGSAGGGPGYFSGKNMIIFLVGGAGLAVAFIVIKKTGKAGSVARSAAAAQGPTPQTQGPGIEASEELAAKVAQG